MEQKNIVATLYLKEGKAVRSMTDFTPVDDVYQLCQLYNDSGIDKIIIFDLSTSDDEHEKNINTIKNISTGFVNGRVGIIFSMFILTFCLL